MHLPIRMLLGRDETDCQVNERERPFKLHVVSMYIA
jgi:hypothetical protein